MRHIKKKKPTAFYDIQPILDLNCEYNMIIGARSNGKTYGALEYALKVYWSTGGEIGYIRRWDEDYKKQRAATLFANHIANGFIEELTCGEYTGVQYYAGRWYLTKRVDDKVVRAPDPFCYAFTIASMEHDKSTSYPKIKTIIFDEFLARTAYLPDEFVKFVNVLSTIIRYRTDVKIFMLGNTVNKYCPYFDEMGLYNIKNMTPGVIDVYDFGSNGGPRIAVEYSDVSPVAQEANKYFAFDNPKLKMISGGAWELAIYPHLPVKYRPKDIMFKYFIKFNDELLQCEIIQADGSVFTFIHRKTSPIKDEDVDIVYCPEVSHKPNWRRRITKLQDKIDRTIWGFFQREKVFYQDNTVGEVVRNYLLWCGKSFIAD